MIWYDMIYTYILKKLYLYSSTYVYVNWSLDNSISTADSHTYIYIYIHIYTFIHHYIAICLSTYIPNVGCLAGHCHPECLRCLESPASGDPARGRMRISMRIRSLILSQWVDWRENLQETIVFSMKYRSFLELFP